MKKLFVTFILALVSFCSYAQYEITKDSTVNQYLITKLDSMGIDDNYILNKYEVEYFNVKFEKERGNFNFSNKKVAFFNSPGGSVMTDKVDYFILEKDRLSRSYTSNFASLIIFNKQQKEKNGGYDAVVYYWSKILRDANFYMKVLKKKASSKNK